VNIAQYPITQYQYRSNPNALCRRYRRIGEQLEQNLPNLDTLILTGNNIQELGDLDVLSSVTTLTTLRFSSFVTRLESAVIGRDAVFVCPVHCIAALDRI